MFGVSDVEAFLDSVTAEQYAEWCAFVAIEPQGWTAANMIQARQVAAMIQPHSRRPVDERKLLLRTFRPPASAATQRARLEAFSARARAMFPDRRP